MPFPSTSSHSRGYGREWQKLRAVVLEANGPICLCQLCKADGVIRPVRDVDHIIPKAQGGTDDQSNLQALSAECHKAKSLADRGCEPKQAIGADGYPVGGTLFLAGERV